ncbi:Multiple epidermal growth factor-like domains protein 8 [Gryganskiella cystojenkinii]|nr:Multiple epidermal growth factor-like domains protein 8 [Gryganskiella cystojenkinii]
MPVPVTYPAFATANSIFYVQGGSPSTDGGILTAAISSLNLAQPFSANSPPWTTLPSWSKDGYSALPSWKHSMAARPDGGLSIWDANAATQTIYMYTLQIWQSNDRIAFAGNLIHYFGYQIWVDPACNFYVPNGCSDSDNHPLTCFYNYTLGQAHFSALGWPNAAAAGLTGIIFYTFTFSNQRASTLFVGGLRMVTVATFVSPDLPKFNADVFEFKYQSGSWTKLTTKGTGPDDINSHCTIETTDYSKMIVFGGISSSDVVSGRLFILDMKTLTWTLGENAPPAQARYGHSCATNGDSFLVWGGQNTTSIMGVNPMIYNIRLNQWVNDFVISGPLPAPMATTLFVAPTNTANLPISTTSTMSTESANLPSSTTKSNLAIIVGGVGGGLVLILGAIGIGIFFVKRQKKKARIQDHQYRHDEKSPSARIPQPLPTRSPSSSSPTSPVLPPEKTRKRQKLKPEKVLDRSLDYHEFPKDKGGTQWTVSPARVSEPLSSYDTLRTQVLGDWANNSGSSLLSENEWLQYCRSPQQADPRPISTIQSWMKLNRRSPKAGISMIGSPQEGPGNMGHRTGITGILFPVPPTLPRDRPNASDFESPPPVPPVPLSYLTTGPSSPLPPTATAVISRVVQVPPIQSRSIQSPPVQGSPVQSLPVQPRPVQPRPVQLSSVQVQLPPVKTFPVQVTSHSLPPLQPPATQPGPRYPHTQSFSTPIQVYTPPATTYSPAATYSPTTVYSPVASYTPSSSYIPATTLTSAWVPRTSHSEPVVLPHHPQPQTSDVMVETMKHAEAKARRMARKKAQLEYDLEKIRLEQELERQIVEGH